MTKDENDKAELVPPMTGFSLPLYALRGAISCCGDEETRPHLRGVYLHRLGNSLRIVATDGGRLFVASFDHDDDTLPDWLAEGGVLISGADLKPRLALIEKLENSTAMVSYANGAPAVVLSDPGEDCVFRLTPVDGTFPDYQTAIVDKMTGAFSREAGDFQPVGYTAAYLKDVAAMSKILASEYVRVFSSTENEPSVVVFDKAPGVVLYLMPSKISSPLAPQTAKLLEGPIKGTIAALNAHKTRWQQKLDSLPDTASEDERSLIQDKIDEYVTRVAKVIANANPPALPAPEEGAAGATAEGIDATGRRTTTEMIENVQTGEVFPVTVHHPAVAADAKGEAALDAFAEAQLRRADVAGERSKLSNRKHKTAAREFLRAVRLGIVAADLDGNLVDAGKADAAFAAGYSVPDLVALIVEREGMQRPAAEVELTFAEYVVAIGNGLTEQGHNPATLADGVPYADWLDAKVTVADAVSRCIDGWLPRIAQESEESEEEESAPELADAAE